MAKTAAVAEGSLNEMVNYTELRAKQEEKPKIQDVKR
jgi:hypothetical protein